jgi:ActR/RegA family two-component response regulator
MTIAPAENLVSESPEGASILVVDDDPTFRERLARAFRNRGLDVRVAAGFEDGLASVTEDAPELAVIDLRMPGKSGLQLLKAIKAIDPETRVVVLTGYGSIASAVEAFRNRPTPIRSSLHLRRRWKRRTQKLLVRCRWHAPSGS